MESIVRSLLLCPWLNGANSISVTCVCVCVTQDEQSALVMVKKHQTLEQALEDYAQTIHQLANSSRTMMTSEHPER